MKYNNYPIIIGLLSLVISTAQAGGNEQKSWYIGTSVGVTDNHNASSKVSAPMNVCTQPGSNCSVDENDRAIQVFGGYNITPNIAVELGHADLGKTANMQGSNANRNVTGRVEQKTTSTSLSLVGKKNFNSRVGVYGKAGIQNWRSKVSGNIGNLNDSAKKSGTDPLVGAGVEYKFNKNISGRVGWDHYFNVGESRHLSNTVTRSINTLKTDVDVYSAGLIYNF